MQARRRVVFLTGTRADFGKMKPLMHRLQADAAFDVHVFVTGMHMLAKYGYTVDEIERSGFSNLYKYINQNHADTMEQVLAKTIAGFSDYVKELVPDLIVVHGDRVEPFAAAAVGALSNIRTAHVEGGEVSGTVDELLRHAITKLSHLHFVANEEARVRLTQLGEREDSIHVIGSPDIDVMLSSDLPSLDQVKAKYDIGFDRYNVLMFHPVTTELSALPRQVRTLVDEMMALDRNCVAVFPNNDLGSDVILAEYARLQGHPRFRVFPSMRFEYFITLLRHADVVIGNSSAGVREAPQLGVPSVNLGSRQRNRATAPSIVDAEIGEGLVIEAVTRAAALPRVVKELFGDGRSAERFHAIVRSPGLWDGPIQKHFIDRVLV